MHYLSLNERLRSLALSDVTISLRLIAKFVTELTYSQNHIVVSSCNVAISMTDIFASFANIRFKQTFPSQKIIYSTSAIKIMTNVHL